MIPLTPVRIAHASANVTTYTVPTPNSDPEFLLKGSDGDLWFSESNSSKIGKIDPSNGTISEYSFSAPGDYANDMTIGPDGNIWFTDPTDNSIGTVTPDGTITEFNTGDPNIFPQELTKGPDDALWFTDGNHQIGRMTTSGTFTFFSLPSQDEAPTYITTGSDGNLWFTTNNDYVARMTTSGQVTADWQVDTNENQGVNEIITGPDGNMWFLKGSSFGNAIDSISPDGTITTYPMLQPNSFPNSLTVGPDGAIWFEESGIGDIGRITTTGLITQYPVPTTNNSALVGLNFPGDGSLWYMEINANKIVKWSNPPGVGPTNLTAASPTQQPPALSWDAITGATSYNIYRNGSLLDSSTSPTYTDTSAPIGSENYYVTAVTTNGESVPSNQISVTVTGASSSITSPNSFSAGMRAPFDFQVTTTGNPTPSLNESGTLPSGVTFTDNGDGTADISGTATAGSNGSYPITITASNGVGSPATQNFVLTITTASSAPAIISSNNDTETFGVLFSYTVNTSGYPAPKLTKSGGLPAGVTFADNGDGTATIAGTPSQSAVGIYNLTLTAKSSAGTTTQAFTLTITKAPVIKKIPNTTTSVGNNLSMTIKSSGYITPSLSETGTLPDGVTFTNNGDGTATISGTPQVSSGGSYSITINATNQLGNASQTFTLKVNEAPVFTSTPSAAATQGQAFSFTVNATGYPTPKFSKTGTLPKGITFTASTGTFSGTPKAGTAGTYPITITAKNNSGTVTQTFTLTVN